MVMQRRDRRNRTPLPQRHKSYWFEKLMAAIALVNLGLVIFDLSYIPFRDLYLRFLPPLPLPNGTSFNLTIWYGQTFKGIEPHHTTTSYVETVAALKQALEQEGLPSRLAEANPADSEVLTLLAALQTQSATLINENPFDIANKSGTFERIKERIRSRVEVESSNLAFQTFWSRAYLAQSGWVRELEFFEQEIAPLMATNYYRSIGFDGRPTNYFLLIDIWFVSIFAAELVLRSIYISRRYQGTNFIDAVLWRWYDVLLLIPIWRFLRVIPVVVRVNQSRLINLDPLSNRIRRLFVTYFAIELTEIVVLRIIEQLQHLIRDGDLTRWLLDEATAKRYVDLNGIDEVQVIAQRLLSVIVYQVLPKLRPDLEALLTHSLTAALQTSPLYANVQRLPGLSSMPQDLTQQLCGSVLDNLYGLLTAALEDEVGAELGQALIRRSTEIFRAEIQQGEALTEIQTLLTVLLDEIKISYLQNLADENVEKLREETQKLYQLTQKSY